jgi:hypothetical protein
MLGSLILVIGPIGIDPAIEIVLSLTRLELEGFCMGLLEIILIVVLILVLLGAFGYGGGAYRGPGIGLGALLLIIIIILLLT